MSPKLADEARVIRLASTMTRTPVLTLQKLETGNGARGCKECRRLHKLTYRAKINAKVA